MTSRKVPLVVAVAVIGAAVAALGLRTRKAAPIEAAARPAGPPAPAARATPAPPPAPTPMGATDPAVAPPVPFPAAKPSSAARTEAALMTRLRDLSGSDPELSLRLAREGNRQFPGSADEPERRFYVVRSLMHLSRSDEARAEARALLDKYPDSEWAQDVHRHLFVNPPTHPLERGYGKTLELEP